MKILSVFLAFLMMTLSIESSHADMKMITTMEVVDSSSIDLKRNQIMTLVQSEKVQAEMIKMGINPQEALARVKTLSPAEVEKLSHQIETAPAGASAVGALLGAVLFVFIVLLITDILGFTHVFPFTRSVN